MKNKLLFHTKQSVFCSEKGSSGCQMNNILLEYVASPFLQLHDVRFIETTLESLSRTLVTVGQVQIDLLVLVARGVMEQPASYFFISVCNLSSTNRNTFFLCEMIKSMHCILLMFPITICGIFLL